MVVRGIERREKQYVEVVADFSEDGRVTPLAIIWEDGRRFEVDRVIEGRYAASMKVGGSGYRYTVSVGGRERFLWRDGERWYVERIVNEGQVALLQGGSRGKPASGANDIPSPCVCSFAPCEL